MWDLLVDAQYHHLTNYPKTGPTSHRVKEIQPEVNVSQICRQVLEDGAALAERVKAQVEEDGMESHIQRFFEPNHAHLAELAWVGYAMDDARTWVETVDPHFWHSNVNADELLTLFRNYFGRGHFQSSRRRR